MPRISYDNHIAEFDDLAAITDLANMWFTSSRFVDGIEGRMRYFTKLHNANNHVFSVLTFNDPRVQEDPRIIGYSSILPERPLISNRHYFGNFNQYELRSEDIFETHEQIAGDRNVFYFQAVGILGEHQNRPQARLELDEMILNHLASILVHYDAPNFCLIAEPYKAGGRALMCEMGFEKLPFQSPLGYDIFHFSPDNPDLPERTSQLLNKLRILRSKKSCSCQQKI